MPDYSKTMIYKLCCNDPTIEEIYIGSTCNFTRRKADHKHTCYNETRPQYNSPVYKFIRDNGGFENWNMYQLEAKSVENKREKETLEREWIEKLKPSLNSNIPTRTKEEYCKDNSQLLNDKTKEWRENNKDILKEKNKEWRENRIEKIKEKFNCDCGGKYTYESKSAHSKRKIHTDYLNSIKA